MHGLKKFLQSKAGKSITLLFILAVVLAGGTKLVDDKAHKGMDETPFGEAVTYKNNFKRFEEAKINRNEASPAKVPDVSPFTDISEEPEVSTKTKLEALKGKKEKKAADAKRAQLEDKIDKDLITKKEHKEILEKVTDVKIKQMQIKEEVKQAAKKKKAKIRPTLSLFSRHRILKHNNDFKSDRFAPYGRLIKCQLINSVESSNLNSPIIAIVAEDLYHDGKRILQAGVELHGFAQKSNMRNRIGADTKWNFVWRTQDDDNGKELSVNGIALDYARDPHTNRWLRTDGSAGLRGLVIEEDDYKMIKLYGMKFIQGVGEGYSEYLTEKLQSESSGDIINSEVTESESDEEDELKAVFGNAASGVAELYVDKILEEIAENGSYVRVVGGTYFYLYLTETLDVSKAKLGGTSKLENLVRPQEESDADVLGRILVKNLKEARSASENRK